MAKDTKNKNNKKQSTISVKTRVDNSKEIQINKTPDKTLLGKIVVWAICVCTFLGIVLSLVFAIIAAMSK